MTLENLKVLLASLEAAGREKEADDVKAAIARKSPTKPPEPPAEKPKPKK